VNDKNISGIFQLFQTNQMEASRRSERMAKVIVQTVTTKIQTKKETSSIQIEKQEIISIPYEEKLSTLQNAAKLLRSTGMKLGYPCLNTSLCTPNHIFRLANYTNEKCLEVTNQNFTCLQKILEYNIQHGFYFFRISSQTVPFASHPVCTIDWVKHFSATLRKIGQYIKENDCRISMHPDQFCLINAKDENIINRSVAELTYHCQLLDEMELDSSAKIQIHVGGVYGDKQVRQNLIVGNISFGFFRQQWIVLLNNIKQN
jgi:UV DNA damage repair endonuclease